MDVEKWYGNQDPARDYRPEKTILSELRFLGCPAPEARKVVDEVLRLRGGATRRDILIQRYRELVVKHYDHLTGLAKETPRGSPNAYRIPGWAKSPNMAISTAARKADPLLWAKGWRGGGRTPDTMVPEALIPEMEAAWQDVYLG